MAEGDDIFTILYEINGQKYLIGVTNTDEPKIASMGVNTPRPLPMKMREALLELVREIKQLDHDPELVDYNSPASRASDAVLGNYDVTPINANDVAGSVEEVLVELKKKLKEKN